MSALCSTLKAWWSFDEASDPRVDGVGGYNATTLQGTIGNAAGKVGNAVVLDHYACGDPRNCYKILQVAGIDQAFEPDDSFYTGGWLYISAAGNDSAGLALFTDPDNGAYWSLAYSPASVDWGGTGTPLQGLWLQFRTPPGLTDRFFATGSTLSTSAWHHVLFWYDAGALTANIQVDGGSVTTFNLSQAPVAGTLTPGDAYFYFNSGNYYAPTFGSGASNTDIRLDEWIYGKGAVPDSGDRTWLYNAGAGRALSELPDYCGISLTETLALIVADPAGILSDPTTPPPGGTGQPVRFSDGGFTDACDLPDLTASVCTRTKRTIPAGLATHLAGEALTLAYCLKLARRDGTILGFTTHDADLTFSGVTYEALNSMSLTALRQELGMTVGTMDLAGLVRSDRVTAADLLAGHYDGAALTLYLVNWADLSQGSVTLARGSWGAVTVVDGRWMAEYRSLAQRLQQQIVELTSPTCRVLALGDARCKVNLAAFQFARTVTAVTDSRQFTCGGDGHGAGYYSSGRAIGTSGDNNGIARDIKRSSGGAIELQEGMPFPVSVGDTFTLEAGCDRRLATCRDVFGNVENFHGEPYVPGYSALIRLQSLVVVG